MQHLNLQWRQKHQVSLDSDRILDYEADNDRRGIRELVYICMLHLDLNRDGGSHQHSHIWDSILLDSCDKVKILYKLELYCCALKKCVTLTIR